MPGINTSPDYGVKSKGKGKGDAARKVDPVGRLDVLAVRLLTAIVGPGDNDNPTAPTIENIVRGLGIPSKRVFTRRQRDRVLGAIEAATSAVRQEGVR